MTSTRYVIRVQASNMRVELRINDIPVGLYAPGEAQNPAEVPVNEFLVNGRNTLMVIAHANPLPSRVFEPWSAAAEPKITLGQAATLELTLAPEAAGAAAPANQPLRLSWRGAAAMTPAKDEKVFEIAAGLPVWAWTRARELSGADVQSVGYPALLRLREILEHRDIAALEKLQAVKLEEITAGAYGVPSAPLRAAFLKGLSACMNDPSWTLRPCGHADVDLRLVGNRRLIECLRTDGSPALSYVKAGSGQTFFLPTMLGFVDGSWQILR